uniref:Uncharacterized protein n=1 Tax=Caenorhabditis japonica TaxID=281687 RepID=A0A8R1HX43_CAEJA
MSSGPDKSGEPPSAKAYKKAVAKRRRIKKMRQMKLNDRKGDVVVSDVSDLDVVGEGKEEPQDAWLNDLLKPDGDGGGEKMVTKVPSMDGGIDQDHSLHVQSPKEAQQQTTASKICSFTNDNLVMTSTAGSAPASPEDETKKSEISLKALLGVGVATVAIALFARLRN